MEVATGSEGGGTVSGGLILVARLNLSVSGLSKLQWQFVTTISELTFISFNSS